MNTLTKPTSDPWMPSGLLSVLSSLFKNKGAEESYYHSQCPLGAGQMSEGVGCCTLITSIATKMLLRIMTVDPNLRNDYEISFSHI